MNNGAGTFCSASLIEPDLALTSNHCVSDAREWSDIEITFGMLNKDVGGGVTRHAVAGYVDADANGQLPGLHMIVVRLDSPVVGIAPVRVAENDDASRKLWKTGSHVTAFGWGMIDEGLFGSSGRTSSAELRQATLKVRDTAVSLGFYRGLLSTSSVRGHPTHGDSGGPLVAGSPEAGYVQVGVDESYGVFGSGWFYNRVGLANLSADVYGPDLGVPLASNLFTQTSGSSVPRVPVERGAAPRQLVVRDVLPGNGRALRRGDIAGVRYVASLWPGGAVFDKYWPKLSRSTDAIGQVHIGDTVKGWRDGLVGIRPGGVRQIIIPPSLAYGNHRTLVYSNGGTKVVPPNTTLIFIVECDAVAPRARTGFLVRRLSSADPTRLGSALSPQRGSDHKVAWDNAKR